MRSLQTGPPVGIYFKDKCLMYSRHTPNRYCLLAQGSFKFSLFQRKNRVHDYIIEGNYYTIYN